MRQLLFPFLVGVHVLFPVWQVYAQDQVQDGPVTPVAELEGLAKAEKAATLATVDVSSAEGRPEGRDGQQQPGLPAEQTNTDVTDHAEATNERLAEQITHTSTTANVENTVQPEIAVEQKDRARSVFIIIASVILIIAFAVLIVLLLKRGRPGLTENGEHVTEAYLHDIHGHTGASTYKLTKKSLMLGRVAGSDSEFLDYLVIPQSTVGRRHALIEFKDYGFWIKDQGSINGTFVNDKLSSSEVRLKHGDKVRLHKFELEFAIPDMANDGAKVIADSPVAGMVEDSIAAEVANIQPGEDCFDISAELNQNEIKTVDAGGVLDEAIPAEAAAQISAANTEETLFPDTDATMQDAVGNIDEIRMSVDTQSHGVDVEEAESQALSPPSAQVRDEFDAAFDETLLPAGDGLDAEENEQAALLPADDADALDAGAPDSVVDTGMSEDDKKD